MVQEKETKTMNEQVQGQEEGKEREVEVVDRGVELPLSMELVKDKDGRVYHNFKIKLMICGRPMIIDMRVKEGDRNAYELAEVIYSIVGANVAPIKCVENFMSDAAGKKTRYMSYLLMAIDPDSGVELCVALRPVGDSSKRLLESYYKQQIRKRESPNEF